MRFTPYPPGSALAPFVEIIWMLEGVPKYRREKVLPNGAVELIFNLGSPHKVVDPVDFGRFRLFRSSWIAGIQARSLIIEATSGSDLVGIRFRPGGFFPFLRRPLSEFTDQVVECSEAQETWTAGLHEQLLESAQPAERLRAIESALLARVDHDRVDAAISSAVGRIRRSGGRVQVRSIAEELGISHKHLIDRFRTVVGMTPKILGRIEKLQGVIRAVRERTEPDWAEVALECGYYDQSHLIDDFRDLTGVTPTRYLTNRDSDENHVILD